MVDLIPLAKQVLQPLYGNYVYVDDIISWHGINIEACHRNQPTNTNVVQYNLLLSL